MNQWQFAFCGPIICGKDSVQRVGSELGALGAKCPMVVTGYHIEEAGLLEPVRAALREVGLSSVMFQRGHINPTDADVVAGAEQYIEAGCDSIIAIGGGSRMDAAKAIRLMVSHGGELEDYYFDVGGASRIKADMPPLICIPTTAGSGSEVSRGAVITDTRQRRKRLLVGPGMMASLAILDPQLSISLSPRLTAETGMDAFSHALETYVGTNFNPFAEGLSRQATKIIYEYLPRAVEDGNDLEARTQMLVGSAMGALSFAKGLGIVHSLAHQLLDVSHGLAIAILLPYGLEFNLGETRGAYADLASAMGIAGNAGETVEAAQEMIEAMRLYSRRFGLPERLSAVGLAAEDIPRMAAGAMQDHCHRTNPRPCTEDDMRQILEKAF